MRLMYYRKNFGDAINPLLIESLSGKKTLRISPEYYKKPHIFAIGSILQLANKHTIIWGSGLISKDTMPLERPKRVCAVRGPKTRELLLKNEIDCPEIYGDPALLLPKIYNPTIEKKYKLGIVPHYVDNDAKWLQSVNDPEVLIINPHRDNPLEFINELLSCEKIAASSLHGLITADAYKIPSTWIKFSDKIIGEGFKYLDYFLSVNRDDKEPLIILANTTIANIQKQFKEYKIEIDLDLLLNSAPFELSNATTR